MIAMCVYLSLKDDELEAGKGQGRSYACLFDCVW